jgi:ABC-type transport system involved in multi-copper enzyme maturation permease subunit
VGIVAAVVQGEIPNKETETASTGAGSSVELGAGRTAPPRLLRVALQRTVAPWTAKIAVVLAISAGPVAALFVSGLRESGEALSYAPFLASMLFAWFLAPIVAVAVAPRALADDDREGYLALLASRGISRRRWLLARIGALAAVLAGVVAVGVAPVGLLSVLLAPSGQHLGAFASFFAGLVHAVVFGVFLAPFSFALTGALPKGRPTGASAAQPRGAGFTILLGILILDAVATQAFGGIHALQRITTVPTLLRATTQFFGPQGGRPVESLVAIVVVAGLTAASVAVAYIRTSESGARGGASR